MALVPYWCCCDGGEPPDLLKAMPCTACCQDYATGLPVDPLAVPDWQTKPVFYLHGNCWQVVGPWDSDAPPDWMIVRSVYDFLRFARCDQCFSQGDCAILTPGCDAVGFVPNRYVLRVRHTGSGDHLNGHFWGTFTWDVTTETEYRPTQPCYTGCLTAIAVNAGGGLAPDLESFHEFGGIEAVNTTVSGSVYWKSNNGNDDVPFSAELLTPATKLAANYKLKWSNTTNIGQNVFSQWTGRNLLFDVVELFTLQSSWSGKLTGPFWLRGSATASTALGLRNNPIAADPAGTVEWSLRPVSYCCDDAPPRPGRDRSPQSSDPNTAAIEAALLADPMRRCRGCGS